MRYVVTRVCRDIRHFSQELQSHFAVFFVWLLRCLVPPHPLALHHPQSRVMQSDPPRLEFRWGVDKSALVKGGCKVVALSELVSVECGVTSDDVNKKVKWSVTTQHEPPLLFLCHQSW